MKVIHIAGTNLKGTTAEYLNQALIHLGYSVGLFTSPHLISINERIKINNKLIDINYMEEKLNLIDDDIVFFNKCFMVAMEYFKENKVDYIILETGIGGRNDITNTVAKDLGIITNIDYDHMDLLGDEISSIAYEKIGIINSSVPIIYGGNNGIDLIKKEIDKYNVKDSYNIDSPNDIALKAVEILEGKKLNINFINPFGRYQEIDNFILDVAHNESSMKYFLSKFKKNNNDIKNEKVLIVYKFNKKRPDVEKVIFESSYDYKLFSKEEKIDFNKYDKILITGGFELVGTFLKKLLTKL